MDKILLSIPIIIMVIFIMENCKIKLEWWIFILIGVGSNILAGIILELLA